MLNSDSRSRSAVGRIALDFGPASGRPRNRPPTMRISLCLAEGVGAGRQSDRVSGGHVSAGIYLFAPRVALLGGILVGAMLLGAAARRSVRRERGGPCDRSARLRALRPVA